MNTAATEKLYDLVLSYCPEDQDALILDLCCGTGTIGIAVAKKLKCKKVIGVEMIEEAVQDAKLNAIKNNLTNIEFIAGKAEDVTESLLHKNTYSNIVAIVDPPRAGLRKILFLFLITFLTSAPSYKRQKCYSCHSKLQCNQINCLCIM